METLKPGTRRFTFITLHSGQRGPYSDHEGVYHIHVEWVSYLKPEDGVLKWKAHDMPRDRVRKIAKAHIGWFDKPETPFETCLESLTKIGPGLWEVRTRAAYTG